MSQCASTNIYPADFDRNWYLVKRGLVNRDRVTKLHDNALDRARSAASVQGDKQVPDTYFLYGDPSLDDLLEELRDAVEHATELELWPTFSYLRVYKNGDLLAAHRDRPACEISMTLNLGIAADQPWPIWIAGPGGIASVALHPGDGMIYRGCDCYHWRDPFEGTYLVQAFLHYVDRHGSRAEWKFDKRTRLAGMR